MKLSFLESIKEKFGHLPKKDYFEVMQILIDFNTRIFQLKEEIQDLKAKLEEK